MNYSHLVEIDSQKKCINIYRVFADGRNELYTSVNIPDISAGTDKVKYENFAKLLGENILIDSPVARELLNI